MFYYRFNIGDYAAHTDHLSQTEDLAYRRLLGLYYLHERPLNVNATSVARQIRMSEHESVVAGILAEFFTSTEDGWVNPRADYEIQAYRGKTEQASRAGKASAERRFNARPTDVQPNKDTNTLINNNTNKQLNKEPNNLQTKEPKNLTKATSTTRRQAAMFIPENVSEIVWKDFLSTRKTKLTQTALTGIAKQADIAGISLEAALQECCTRGWQSFKADWVSNQKGGGAKGNSLAERNQAVAALWLAEQDAKEKGVEREIN